MALGAANKQQMQPAQYVNAVNAEGLFRPGNFSSPNVNTGLFRPQETMPLVQSQMQQTTRDNVARQALQDAEPWAVLERMQSVLEKSQPNLERIKYNRAMDMQSLLNNEVRTIGELHARAYKGDMNAQAELANFTFRPEILEGSSIEQFSALRDQLNKAQLSVANSGVIAASQTVKKDLAERVQKLTGEGNEDAMALASLIGSTLVQSGTSAIPQQQIENIKDRIAFYRAKYPKSQAIDSNIVDQYKMELQGADKSRLEDAEYGSGRMSVRDASSLMGNLGRIIAADPMMAPEQKEMFQAMIINAAGKSGLLNGAMMPGMPSPAANSGEPSTLDRLKNAINALKTPSK
jgi:hypothetical protein